MFRVRQHLLDDLRDAPEADGAGEEQLDCRLVGGVERRRARPAREPRRATQGVRGKPLRHHRLERQRAGGQGVETPGS